MGNVSNTRNCPTDSPAKQQWPVKSERRLPCFTSSACNPTNRILQPPSWPQHSSYSHHCQRRKSMSERELELLARIEDLERHTWRNSAILRAVAMVAFTAMIGIVIASGVVGGGRGSHWSGPAWNTMWLYGLFAANAVSMFWTTHKD